MSLFKEVKKFLHHRHSMWVIILVVVLFALVPTGTPEDIFVIGWLVGEYGVGAWIVLALSALFILKQVLERENGRGR